MQAIAVFAGRPRRGVTHHLVAAIIFGGAGSASAMELDHTAHIEIAANETGCALRSIGEGKKRSGQMIYRVTCEQNGATVDREVACKFNACTFAAETNPKNE